MPPKKAARPAQENISLGPQIREGELVFGGKFRPASDAGDGNDDDAATAKFAQNGRLTIGK